MSLVIVLVAGMVLIVLSADYFTNGVEWLGYRLGLGEGVSGSLLAALGTALPETLVPLMAFIAGGIRGGQAHQGIGLGAILGAPFMLSTLGFSVIGVGVWLSGQRRQGLAVSKEAMLADLRFFLLAFGLVIITAWLPEQFHVLVALVLVGGYGYHAWQLVKQGRGAAPESAPDQPLHFHPRSQPSTVMVALQVMVALFGLVVGAHFFVSGLEGATGWVKLSGFLVSVIVTPLATELPEVLNSVIWIRRGKGALAVGNVTGAMAFQASLVPALGIFMTSWRFSLWEMVTAVLAWGAALWTLVRSRDGVLHLAELFAAGLFYLLFILLVAAIL
ncbi:sodium:calcium antiporter [Sulfobacillus harzensis]|uniref:Sodium:calcium antiporter n=1 Tax=Sulfobacillus harzensis TaxID=2729629 RepID=A0A7Y0L1N7_9FIRM|nr:sodium:calcium antiporter [Sulfobacillus harzensis]NMP21659.1 sodium:calcium antiporter [Sulfobacillus harzensis]